MEEKEKQKKKKVEKKEFVEETQPETKIIYVEKKKKSKTPFVVGLITFLIIAVGCGGLFIWLVGSGKLESLVRKIKNKLDNNTTTEKVEIEHTESTTIKSDGVYITDVSEVVEKVMPSIVAITSKTVISSGNFGPSFFGYGNNSYTAEGAGSGVIVSEDDDEIFILTNYHVVENTTELSIKFIDDKSCDATIKGVSERKDIAIVSVKKKDLDSETLKAIKIANLGDSNTLKVGNGIIAIGNALGYGQSVTVGVVSALNREVATDDYSQEMIQIDAPINGGNSGGALLNSKGEVVGINSAKYSSKSSSTSASIEGMGFAIPISDVKDIISELIKGKNDESGVLLGIEGYMTNSGNIASYQLPSGFYVATITKGGSADSSDLEIGNIITEIDGNKVTSIDVIKKVLNKKNKGDTVTLKVKYVSRNEYKEKTVKIKLK